MLLFMLIVIYMIMLPATMILMLMKILDIVEEMNKSKETNNKSVLSKRKHTNIGSSNYNSVFNKRDNVKYNYDDYKNTKGLYEPVTPHKPGVKVHKKED